MTKTNLVLTERHGGVAVLTLNDAQHRNVLSERLVQALGDAVDKVEEDADARCIVITGAGSAFCAGAELGTLEAAAQGDFEGVKGVYEGFLRILQSSLVTIAAVNGPAVGAGVNLALACDVRLAGVGAKFDTRFAQLRIHPGGGHLWMLSHAIGREQATLAVVFGESLDAEGAHRAGLVSSVQPAESLISYAVALGRRLDGYDRDYLEKLISSVRESTSIMEHNDALERETVAQQWSTTLPGFKAGVADVVARVRASSDSR